MLLGRGDFYQCFLEEARALLAAPPRASTAEADLAVPFAQAASKSSAANDAQKLARRFRLRLGSPEGADARDRGGRIAVEKNASDFFADATRSRRRVPAYDAWDSLSLEYAVREAPWLAAHPGRAAPLRRDVQVPAPPAPRRQGAGRGLGSLRRVAAGAATTTPGALRAEEEREARRRRRFRGMDAGTTAPNAAEVCERVRRDVAFLVRNWLTYLQTDVVEAQFREMMAAMDARDEGRERGGFREAKRGTARSWRRWARRVSWTCPR